VRAKNGPNLNFFENQETYPIFEIRRWHGQDRDESLRSKPADLGSLELEVLRRLMQDSTRSDHEISEAIKAGIKQGHTDTLVDDLNRIGTENVGDARQSLLDNDVLLGYSVDYDLEDMGWNRAVMGISLKPGYSDEGHDAAVEKLMSFDDDMGKGVDAPLNNFTLPYITSGLGQSWADLMLEIIVSDTSDINKIASRIREEIESVESTRTHLMTKSLMDDSITVDNWHQIASNNHQH
jgi:DNA-binding Lrp family transcriptional regulator